MNVLSACMYVYIHVYMYVSGVFRGQERVSDLLKLALQKPVIHIVGDGAQTLVHCKSSKCS